MTCRHSVRLSVLALCLATGSSFAAADPQSMVRYRQSVMKAAGGHFKAANLLLSGDVVLPGQLEKHAQALADLGPMLPEMFPDGTDLGNSDAKEKIWSDWPDFLEAAKDYQKRSTEFLAAVRGGNKGAMVDAATSLRKTCKSCHDEFKDED